ncbi:heterodisulfide reductase-related iron-sulfur binding cluster [Gemmatimonas aurantiaca]|uniref:heterodisulfide reductase-related iron-sulfur binding cluster n=1 Tax=Gemmatimonas aurantiaca TaxID=173480 RepID=UPI00301B828A
MSAPTATSSRDLAHAAGASCALPGTPLAHASAGLDACVHCGFCLQACPTYVNLEDENDSPRGRIVLMRRMLEGDIALDDPAALHIDRCLGCRACETACPSGVPYGELLEATRATMVPRRGIPFIARPILFVFRHHLLLRTALFGAKVFRSTGLPRLLARLLPSRLAFPMAMLASTAPSRVIRNARGNRVDADPRPTATRSRTEHDAATGRTAMLEGCVMSGLFTHVNAATAEALTHNGHALCEAPGQRCCGALHAHAGDMGAARALAKENIAAFEHANVDTIVVNAAGCGAMLKQYAHLLHDDPEWADRARRISERTRDVSEALAATGPVRGTLSGTGSGALRVTHDPPCHQMHAQRIVAQPLQVLGAIEGLDLVPLEDADQCCGSAGIYNLVEPGTSDAVLHPKLQRIAETHASVLATGNPGCMMQIGAGLLLSGSETTVVHPVELLAAAYTNSSAAAAS